MISALTRDPVSDIDHLYLVQGFSCKERLAYNEPNVVPVAEDEVALFMLIHAGWWILGVFCPRSQVACNSVY